MQKVLDTGNELHYIALNGIINNAKQCKMIEFNLTKFLVDKRLKTIELAEIIGTPLRTVQMAKFRGTIKVDFLRTLELKFGDCSQYIVENKKRKKKVA